VLYYILGRFGLDFDFSRQDDVVQFVGRGVLGCTLASATIGATTLYISGFVPDWSYALAVWWMGDATGVLMVTPAAPINKKSVRLIMADDHIDNVNLTRLFLHKAGNQHVAIIALTANAMKGDRDRYLTVGMNDYVSKPIDRGQLIAAVDRQLARS